MTDFASGVEEPLDLITMSLNEKVYVKARNNRELKGKLLVSGNSIFFMQSGKLMLIIGL